MPWGVAVYHCDARIDFDRVSEFACSVCRVRLAMFGVVVAVSDSVLFNRGKLPRRARSQKPALDRRSPRSIS